jgi:hypothetical protein
MTFSSTAQVLIMPNTLDRFQDQDLCAPHHPSGQAPMCLAPHLVGGAGVHNPRTSPGTKLGKHSLRATKPSEVTPTSKQNVGCQPPLLYSTQCLCISKIPGDLAKVVLGVAAAAQRVWLRKGSLSLRRRFARQHQAWRGHSGSTAPNVAPNGLELNKSTVDSDNQPAQLILQGRTRPQTLS